MITKERMRVETAREPFRLEPTPQVVHTAPPPPAPEAARTSLLWRLVLVSAGFGLAAVGWVLALSVFLAFIGVPLFILGLALMQAQER